MKVGRKALEQLLVATMREQHISGKAQPQVESCVLNHDGKRTYTLCLVKDGKTSLSSFSIEGEEQESSQVPVPSIERLLGVLKYHGTYVTLKYESGKVVVKSAGKQTTLVGGYDAKAFSTSQDSLKDWAETAAERAVQVAGDTYKMADGRTRSAFASLKMPASDLYDALRCDGMNGQKLNRYTFDHDGDTLVVKVGDHFKGLTMTVVAKGFAAEAFTATFEGGLENVVRHYSGDVALHFLDFTPEGQGIRLIMCFDNGDWVFQAGVL